MKSGFVVQKLNCCPKGSNVTGTYVNITFFFQIGDYYFGDCNHLRQ